MNSALSLEKLGGKELQREQILNAGASRCNAEKSRSQEVRGQAKCRWGVSLLLGQVGQEAALALFCNTARPVEGFRLRLCLIYSVSCTGLCGLELRKR